MSTDTIANEVAIATEYQLPSIRRDATVMELAAVIAGSRDFPDCRTPEKAAVRILAGKEMGVGPISSVIGIRVQNGRVSMDATLMAGCIKRSAGDDYLVEEHSNDRCRLTFYDGKKVVGDSVFTLEDAKRAGLKEKDTWKQYPRNMLFARALSNGARWYCAGIFGGSVYTHEELGYSVDDEGRAIEAEPGAGNELCTRDQRQEIARLVDAIGDSMPKFLATLGVKLLDELSQYEAEKEIKKLGKRVAKQGPTTSNNAAAQADASVVAGSNATQSVGQPTVTPAPAATDPPPTASQETMAEAFDESRKPSTDRQREQIISLAERLVPEEQECREMIVAALTKRNCRKLADLNHLQAAALIESIRAKLEESCPFEPMPATSLATENQVAVATATATKENPLPMRAQGSKPK
jgi:hypothetical protein